MENERLNKIYTKVFIWMFVGLLVTFLTGLYTSTNKDALEVVFSTGGYWGFAIAEIVIAIVLSVRIQKMNSGLATFLYLLYTFLTGLTFSSIFIVYKVESIIWIFLITSALFLIFALIGHFTKIDLTKFSTILLMMLLGLVFCGILNIFIQSESFDMVLCGIAVIIFLGYIAFDIQKIKNLQDAVPEENLAIISAFQLYLDFINVFIELLRLFGKSKD